MSLYTRLASTDAQEEAVKTVEKAFKKAERTVAGYTTIGKSPQTVVLDIYHHGSNIYIDSDGTIDIRKDGAELTFDSEQCDEIADVIKAIYTEYRIHTEDVERGNA